MKSARCFVLLVVLAAVELAAGCGLPASTSGGWDRDDTLFTFGPYIVPGGNGTAFVAVKGGGLGEPTFEYWLEDPSSPQGDVPPSGVLILSTEMPKTDDLWIASLRDLDIDKRVAYRIRSARGTTPIHRFRIGRRPDEHFRFAAFGDTRTGHSVHRAVVEAVAREQIDFVVNTGDLVDRGGVNAEWTNFFQIERPLLADTPIIPAIGNHDWSGRQYFRRYFMLSRWTGDRRYHVQDWGNFRLLTVDAGIECREGCDQFAFANQALAEGAQRGMLMAIQLHFPPYSSGKHGSNKAVQEPITDLARRHGVELVIAGHDHNYERTKPIDGTTYVVSGSAGAPIRPVSPKLFTANARTEPHYVLFDVEGNRIALRAVNMRGEVFDSTVLKENPAQEP